MPFTLNGNPPPPPPGPMEPSGKAHPIVRRIFIEAQKKGWTQEQLALAADKDARLIRAWKEAEKTPRMDTLDKLLGAVGLRLTIEDAAPQPRRLGRGANPNTSP